MRQLLLWIVALSPALAIAQDLTHPTRMGLPESSFERPDPADYELALDNGLVAFVAEARQVPLVTMTAFIRAGTIDDQQQGAAEALLEALRAGGPSGASPAAFRDALTRMTADYVVEMHPEWTEVRLNVPTEDLDEALDLFAYMVVAPAISNASLDKAAARAQPEGEDLGGESGPALYEGSLTIAVDRFYDVLYADHPFGYRPTTEDFDNLTVNDVREFHARYFVPGNTTLAIAGDIDADDMQGRLAERFGNLRRATVPARPSVPDVRAGDRAQHTFPVGKLQSWLVFGHALPVVPLDEEAALEVMNYILAGGHLYTRMTVETRYKYGYTNDASGFLEPRWFGPGAYNFRSYSRHEVIRPIYDNMMSEIDLIRSEPVTDEELFIAKGALTEGAFQVRYLDGYSIARHFALERLRYGDHSRSATYVDRVRSVTADDVLDAARRYLQPDEMQVVLVGEDIDLIDPR
jgi:predicted Zn-dependent peptidase